MKAFYSFLLGATVYAQQAPATRPTPTAPPPIVWPSPPLSDGPILEETGVQRQIRINVTKGVKGLKRMRAATIGDAPARGKMLPESAHMGMSKPFIIP